MSGMTQTTYSLDRLVTIPQLSERLGVSVATIRDWIHRQFIPYVKLGRRIYFDVGVINAWIEEKAHPGRIRRKAV